MGGMILPGYGSLHAIQEFPELAFALIRGLLAGPSANGPARRGDDSDCCPRREGGNATGHSRSRARLATDMRAIGS